MEYRRSHIKGGSFFFTVVTYNREKLFNPAKNIELLSESIKYVKQKHPFTIDAFVLLPEHIHYNAVKHGLVQAPKDWQYSSFHRYAEKGVYEREWGEYAPIQFASEIGME
jgi:REP element-mobilizing transposase RayT